ncbi:MAG: hypothetical protein CMH10_01485 [Marinovum sp.]|nr:hypothetical protein [Marinovum sp.]
MALRSSLDLQTSKGRNLSPPQISRENAAPMPLRDASYKGFARTTGATTARARLKSINTAAV